jgi:diguanylate cyclase (GGDEF)-like protein
LPDGLIRGYQAGGGKQKPQKNCNSAIWITKDLAVMFKNLPRAMSAEESSELLDCLVNKDWEGVCQTLESYLRHPNVSLWFYHFWDRGKGRFRLVYPAKRQAPPVLATDLYDRLAEGKPLVDNNAPENYGDWAETRECPVTLLLPLFDGSELIGVLQGFLNDRDKGHQVAEEIETARRMLANSWRLLTLLEEKDRLAWTDDLTGLFNYRFLLHFLRMELARCTRYRKSAAVLFMDVDWFKRVNDTYGHLQGSAILTEFAGLLSCHVRQADAVVRYGGDEFVIVLTEIAFDEAVQVAERLREMISQYCFRASNGQTVRLTVSIGVAGYPEHADSAEKLIHCADTAMYLAKQDNKNCIKIAL